MQPAVMSIQFQQTKGNMQPWHQGGQPGPAAAAGKEESSDLSLKTTSHTNEPTLTLDTVSCAPLTVSPNDTVCLIIQAEAGVLCAWAAIAQATTRQGPAITICTAAAVVSTSTAVV